ncbi:FG-GAP repeat domain-containing protein [Pleionea sediminis]|uniref:FG-GAP repeat domain-containing protein n=1 Tax=Pleionea sediminis TaxID=2569479 RepID=UPI0011865FBD|nr:VCBS repeat-containing protein [Pleionea sediminis]
MLQRKITLTFISTICLLILSTAHGEKQIGQLIETTTLEDNSRSPNKCDTETYAFLNGTASIGGTSEYQPVVEAFNQWSALSHKKFVYTSDINTADIVVSWSTNGHLPPNNSFSNYANYVNQNGQTHLIFNDYYSWRLTTQDPVWGSLVDVKSIALKWIGRIESFVLNNEPDSILYHQYVKSIWQHSLRDINRIRNNYSECSTFGHYRLGPVEPLISSYWPFKDDQRLLSGDFWGIGNDQLMIIDPSGVFKMLFSSSPANAWLLMDHGGSEIVPGYFLAPWDHYATGDFNGDGKDELLVANPLGRYRTLSWTNGQSWSAIQSANNGDIDSDDRFVSGDFDGDGADELILIKTDGRFFTMDFNTITSNWDIRANASGTNGIIYWWITNVNDVYAAGDFNNDGKDELLAMNFNGWHHTMHLTPVGWRYLEGNGSGWIGGYQLGWNDIALVGNFDNDPEDEVVLTNKYHPWSVLMEFRNNNSWHQLNHNQGQDLIADWNTLHNDSKITGEFFGLGKGMIFSARAPGDWQLIEFTQ